MQCPSNHTALNTVQTQGQVQGSCQMFVVSHMSDVKAHRLRDFAFFPRTTKSTRLHHRTRPYAPP